MTKMIRDAVRCRPQPPLKITMAGHHPPPLHQNKNILGDITIVLIILPPPADQIINNFCHSTHKIVRVNHICHRLKKKSSRVNHFIVLYHFNTFYKNKYLAGDYTSYETCLRPLVSTCWPQSSCRVGRDSLRAACACPSTRPPGCCATTRRCLALASRTRPVWGRLCGLQLSRG